MRSATAASFALVCLAGTAIGQISFGTPSNLAAPERPAGLASGDFNADGFIDLAVTTDNVDKISIFNGSAAGLTGPTSVFTGAGTGPDDLIASDVDGDGDLDLVVALKGADQVRLYTNAFGFFTAGASVAVGAEPADLAAGDLDADGDTDFATANRDGASVSVLRNDAGVLASWATIANADEVKGVAIAQLTGSAALDIAFTSPRTRQTFVLSGNGAGAFAQAQVIAAPVVYRPEGIVAADVSGDGLADLAVTLSDDAITNVVGIYTQGGGTLIAGPTFTTGGLNASGIAAADLDVDGDVDLAAGNTDSGTVVWLTNISNIVGGPLPTFTSGAPIATGAGVDRVLLADLDNNGSADAAVSNTDSNTVTVFLNARAGGPCSPADLTGDGQIDSGDLDAYITAFLAAAASADLTGDGQVDSGDLAAFIGLFLAGC
jgi:hypothetical protein